MAHTYWRQKLQVCLSRHDLSLSSRVRGLRHVNNFKLVVETSEGPPPSMRFSSIVTFWNYTSAWIFSGGFSAGYLQNTFLKNITSVRLLLKHDSPVLFRKLKFHLSHWTEILLRVSMSFLNIRSSLPDVFFKRDVLHITLVELHFRMGVFL